MPSGSSTAHLGSARRRCQSRGRCGSPPRRGNGQAVKATTGDRWSSAATETAMPSGQARPHLGSHARRRCRQHPRQQGSWCRQSQRPKEPIRDALRDMRIPSGSMRLRQGSRVRRRRPVNQGASRSTPPRSWCRRMPPPEVVGRIAQARWICRSGQGRHLAGTHSRAVNAPVAIAVLPYGEEVRPIKGNCGRPLAPHRSRNGKCLRVSSCAC